MIDSPGWISTLMLLVLVVNNQLGQNDAASMSSLPTVLRHGDGITILDQNNMVRGGPVPPPEIVVVSNDDQTKGTLMFLNGSKVPVDPDQQQIQSAFSPQENQDISYLEWFYNTAFNKNANQINAQWKKASAPTMPWPGSYWPSYQDGINVRWDNGGISAAEKFAKANNLNVASFLDKVSADTGIDSQSYYQTCTSSSQCSSGTRCGIRYGKRSGYCIPTWIGICHAWAPAAIFEPEPKCPVKINGVTFKVMDIKALVSQVYDGAGLPVLYGGTRFDGGDNDQKDSYGRFVNLSHRDIGPAVFHIALANILGRLRKNFLVDASAGYTVWNQPIRSYEFSNPVVMKPNDAALKYFNTPSYAVFNKDAVSVHYVTNTFKYIEEGYSDGQLSIPSKIDTYTYTEKYEYLLELDKDGNILGGEWVGNSRTNHPDFLWVALRKPNPDTVTKLGISYAFVSDLIQKSVAGSC